MPALPGFSDNPFRSQADVIYSALSLLQPLEQYKSPNNARIKIATSTAAGFGESSSQLEGFARPLWAVADLLRIKSDKPESSLCPSDVRLESWIAGLRAGTDPLSSEYWGDLFDIDQRMVEMEAIAYALLTHPDAFCFADDEAAKKNLIRWLHQINQYNLPQNNWLWFRVLVNLALVKALCVPLAEVRNYIDSAFQVLDTFNIGDGWSSDGIWGPLRKQADYYSGSFAIQFAQLLFVKFAPDYDVNRTRKYKAEARDFAKGFWRYFNPEGAAIPFGRSLTYRFAMAAFWAAVAVAEVELPAPLNHIGIIKGLLLRHLRWWSKHTDIFNTDGTLNIGYTYPNMYMAEDYNSPQSVYWSLKSFIILGLDTAHPFWSAEEQAHPLSALSSSYAIPEIALIQPPRHVICNTPMHHFLLSSGQSTSKRFKAREAKYGKFAYSSLFGFSVPCGAFLEQMAPDSTLAVKLDDEDDPWKVRWDPFDVRSGTIAAGEEKVPILTSSWKPWKKWDLIIETTLVAPIAKWPGWHIRVHKVTGNLGEHNESMPVLHLVDGGFAASAQTSQNFSIFERPLSKRFEEKDVESQQGWWSDDKESLVISEHGASGVVDLTKDFIVKAIKGLESTTMIIRADPNTNLVAQQCLIPAAKHILKKSNHRKEQHLSDAFFVTGIFASASNAGKLDNIWEIWNSRPVGQIQVPNGEICLD